MESIVYSVYHHWQISINADSPSNFRVVSRAVSPSPSTKGSDFAFLVLLAIYKNEPSKLKPSCDFADFRDRIIEKVVLNEGIPEYLYAGKCERPNLITNFDSALIKKILTANFQSNQENSLVKCMIYSDFHPRHSTSCYYRSQKLI